VSERPRHVGRETDAETGYALVCNATADGDPWKDALCGQPALWHIRWTDALPTENSFACADHLGFALRFNPFDVHSVENSACGIPGSYWVPGNPSHCMMMALDGEPDRSGHAALETTS
jgi:hypothetical protein